VHLSARIAALAGPDETLASADVLAAAGSRYRAWAGPHREAEGIRQSLTIAPIR